MAPVVTVASFAHRSVTRKAYPLVLRRSLTLVSEEALTPSHVTVESWTSPLEPDQQPSLDSTHYPGHVWVEAMIGFLAQVVMKLPPDVTVVPLDCLLLTQRNQRNQSLVRRWSLALALEEALSDSLAMTVVRTSRGSRVSE